MPVYIAYRWIPYLDMLPNKDFCILVKAILHHEDEPTISPKFQAIAHNIYEDMRELARAREGMKKTRSDRNCYSNSYSNSYVTVTETVTQEEKKEKNLCRTRARARLGGRERRPYRLKAVLMRYGNCTRRKPGG